MQHKLGGLWVFVLWGVLFCLLQLYSDWVCCLHFLVAPKRILLRLSEIGTPRCVVGWPAPCFMAVSVPLCLSEHMHLIWHRYV